MRESVRMSEFTNAGGWPGGSSCDFPAPGRAFNRFPSKGFKYITIVLSLSMTIKWSQYLVVHTQWDGCQWNALSRTTWSRLSLPLVGLYCPWRTCSIDWRNSSTMPVRPLFSNDVPAPDSRRKRSDIIFKRIFYTTRGSCENARFGIIENILVEPTIAQRDKFVGNGCRVLIQTKCLQLSSPVNQKNTKTPIDRYTIPIGFKRFERLPFVLE